MSLTHDHRRTRRAVCVLIVLAGCTHVSTASAGTYEVHACDAAGGANHSWGTSVSHGAMAAYTACPTSGDGNRGIVTRNSVGGAGAVAPAGAAGRAVFTAPAGTSIAAIRASYSFFREDPAWQVGLSNGSTLLRGCLPGGGSICSAASGDEYIPVPGGSTVLYVETFCPAGFCSTSSSGHAPTAYVKARANLYGATVVISDGGQPSLNSESRGLLSDGWKRGKQDVVFSAGDASGIRETRVYVDDAMVGRITHSCDSTQPAPCPNGGDNYSIETGSVSGDGKHTVAIEAIDAAGNSARGSREVWLDNTPPSAPRGLAIDSGDGWRATNDFKVGWSNPKDAGSPISGAEYEVCAAGGADCRRGTASGKDLSSLSGIKVPGPGDWELRVWLRDEAGNESRSTAAEPVRLRYDDKAPTAAFAPTDPNDPTRLAVDVDDSTSGLGGGAIELRRQGATAWVPLDSRVDRDQLATDLQDERLGDGVYELRARAADRAGNERSTDQRKDGSRAQLTLPLRLKTRLVVGAPRRVKRKQILRRVVRAPYGRRVRLRGRLTSADGTAFAGQELVVQQRVHQRGATFTPVAKITTTKTGRFSYRSAWGPSRTLRFRYVGTRVIRPVNTDVRLNVPAKTTMRTGRRSFVNGEYMRLRGRLRGGRIPPEGKLIELQVRLRGRYRTFATTRANRSGRWEYRYRFDGTRGRQVYSFRAQVPREATYPFRTGVSVRRSVVVRGL